VISHRQRLSAEHRVVQGHLIVVISIPYGDSLLKLVFLEAQGFCIPVLEDRASRDLLLASHFVSSFLCHYNHGFLHLNLRNVRHCFVVEAAHLDIKRVQLFLWAASACHRL